jgi:hypothetical protein
VPTIVSPLSSILPKIPAFAGNRSAVSSYFRAASEETIFTVIDRSFRQLGANCIVTSAGGDDRNVSAMHGNWRLPISA